jgi:hypothetical protein
MDAVVVAARTFACPLYGALSYYRERTGEEQRLYDGQ